MAYLDFTEMPVWQLAIEIVEDVYKLTEVLPKCEDYALRGQTRDAAVSISGNIAEGFGRSHGKDKRNFYWFARGSSYEVRSHLYAGVRVGYYAMEQTIAINSKCLRVIEDLNRIVKNLSTTLPKP